MCEYQGMQDIHAIGGGGGGGGGRLFGGGGGGGGADRRLRPNQANNVHGTGHPHHHHQALKCPRCDSLNTKFCYYNNYNLSQPRHFCKSCRRYWTKGGVLRNVPIGGGCRKSKRSTKPSNKHTTSASSPTDTTTDVTVTATATSSATNTAPPETTPPQQNQEPISSNSHSSSESSSLTAMTNTATTAGAGNTGLEAISGHSPGNSILNGVGESKLFVHMNNSMQPGFEASFLDQGSDCGGIFSEIGSFTNLITSTNEQMAQFGFSNLLNQHGLEQQVQQGQDQHWQQQQQQQHQQEISMKMQNMAGGGAGLIDQTVEAELSAFQSRNGCGFTSLDWQGNGDQGFFDLSSTVDPAYWSSSQSQWTNTNTATTTTDQDHQHQHQHQHHPSLYLP